MDKITGLPGGSDGKESACNAGDLGLILGLGRSPGEENGNPLQYSCLEDTKDRGVWLATVHGAAKNWTLFAYTQIYECFGSTTSICCHVFLRSHNLNRI